jgi:hypothetical protein
MMTSTHAEAFARTEAGRAEIQARGVPMSRPARNLLMVIDASCSGDAWIGKVNGSTPADLDVLINAGLVAPQGGRGGKAGAGKTVYQRIPVEVAVRDWTYDALYTLLTHEAKERFGLIKGYRLILKIEGCADLAGIQAVALDFVEQIRKAHGEESATRFRKQLGATE